MLFLIVSVVAFNTVVILIPKRITLHEMYTVGLFALVVALITDIYLDLKLNLYGFFTKGPELEYLIVALGTYPSVNMIYMNFFPTTKGALKKILYIIAWSLFYIFYEWCTLRFGILYYAKWRLIYSAFVYPATFLLLAVNLKFIRYLRSKE